MSEEPEESAWRAQGAWAKEMRPATKRDYILSGIMSVALLPIYVVFAPIRWWHRRFDGDD